MNKEKCKTAKTAKENMYRYIFNPKKTKTFCPECGRKRFVQYYDLQEEILLENYGRCERINSCKYFLHPSSDGHSNVIDNFNYKCPLGVYESNRITDYHNQEIFEKSKFYLSNLHVYLVELFGQEIAIKIFEMYYLATSTSDQTKTIYWQVDEQNRIRGGKVMGYTNRGKRTKSFTWVHSILKKKGIINQFNLEQCLFGLHLIKNDIDTTIALVESEKTACIMSVIFPKYFWLACGSKTEFKLSKITAIKDRNIIVFPDCEIQKDDKTTYDEWYGKAMEFNSQGFRIHVSDILEKRATYEQKLEGVDIADFFMKS